MIEKWFLQDIEQQLQFRNKVCIIDPKGAIRISFAIAG